MESIFNLEKIRKELNSEDWIEGLDGKYRTVYVGSIFNMLPSGKVYTIFANGNLDVCSNCDGDGVKLNKICCICGGHGSEEAYKDSLWYEQANKELESINCCLESGECDGCDLFVTEYKVD